MKARTFTALLFLMLAVQAARAGETISIRLIEATFEGNVSDKVQIAELSDVAKVLSKKMGLKNLKVIDRATVPIDSKGSTVKLGPYRVSCGGRQEGQMIVVYRKNKQLLNTQVALRDKKPLILGMFPAADDKKHVLVFVAK